MENPAMDVEFNRQFDHLIEVRRTVRLFADAVPPRESIEQIIRAGLLGPYAALAVREERVFRRFFVFERGTASIAAVEEIAINQLRIYAEKMKARCESDPEFASRAGEFLKGIQMLVGSRKTPITDAPYYVVVAEKAGYPPAGTATMAHVLENMWLKATALGLGFRLVSMTEQMSASFDFCDLLGVKKGDFGFDGCTIGYATQWPEPTPRPAFQEAVTWMR